MFVSKRMSKLVQSTNWSNVKNFPMKFHKSVGQIEFSLNSIHFAAIRENLRDPMGIIINCASLSKCVCLCACRFCAATMNEFIILIFRDDCQ